MILNLRLADLCWNAPSTTYKATCFPLHVATLPQLHRVSFIAIVTNKLNIQDDGGTNRFGHVNTTSHQPGPKQC